MNDLPLAQPVTVIYAQPESVIMLTIAVVAIAFLIGLAVGDWHGYRRRRQFEDEIVSSFDLDLTLDGGPSYTPIVEADDNHTTNVYKSMGSKREGYKMKTPYVVEFVSADGKSTFQIEERVSPTLTRLWLYTYDTKEQAELAAKNFLKTESAYSTMLGYQLKDSTIRP